MCASRASPTCVFETPRTRLRNPGRPMIAGLLTMRAEKDRECIKSIGIRFSAPFLRFGFPAEDRAHC